MTSPLANPSIPVPSTTTSTQPGLVARRVAALEGRPVTAPTAAVSTQCSEDVFSAAACAGIKLRRSNLNVDSMGLGCVVY